MRHSRYDPDGQEYRIYVLDVDEISRDEVKKFSYRPKDYSQKIQTDYDSLVEKTIEKIGCSREEAIIYLDR